MGTEITKEICMVCLNDFQEYILFLDVLQVGLIILFGILILSKIKNID
jgi:hypothetical protein